ncbi:TPA: hypothetical protein DEP96_02550 [Candidatus Uhrbacteria bacterium]|nr:hypothetical protein [Candidatus Uhrbacteria bacterium]
MAAPQSHREVQVDNKNIEDIDRVMMSAILAERALVIDALAVWGVRQRALSREQKLTFWQTKLDVKECMLFKLLIQAGVTRYCEYAAMTETEFEAAVTNRTNRLTISVVMAGKGLRRGVEFSEEMWRTLQGRPQNVLADSQLRELTSMKLKDYVHKHSKDFNDFECRMLGKLPRTVLWAMVHSEILEDVIDESLESGLQSGGSIAASFFKSIEKRGLWREFEPTQIEKPYVDALRI